MSDFTIKLSGTQEEVQIATAKIQSVWGIDNIESMSGIFPSNPATSNRFNRPFHRYINLDPHAPIAIEDINGNKVKQGPLSRILKRKESNNG